MKKKILFWFWLFLITLIFAVIMQNMQAAAQNNTKEETVPEELKDLYAQSAVLMDADTGRILFGKNADERLPMASTTKIMTCILVLEHADLKEKAIVSANAASQPKVRLGVAKGEMYYIEDLLYSLMLESHNDSAVVLAEHVAGSVEDFAAMMNQKAKELGLKDTYFITPNGLDAFDETGIHASTAADLALIMRYCIQNSYKREEFLHITQTKHYSFQDASGNRTFLCNNHNAFLDMMEGVLSGKTGFTADAGYCYVGALKQEKETYIVTLLACGWPNNKNYKWSDTKKLMEYGLKNYSYKNIWKRTEIEDVIVKNGMPKAWEKQVKVSVQEKNEEQLCLLVREDEKLTIEIEMEKEVKAPIVANSKAGEIKYYISSSIIGKNELYFLQTVDKKSFLKYLVKITKKMLIF